MGGGSRKLDVVLAGREQPGDENLALRYLAAALTAAGHRPHIVPLCGPEHLEPAARRVHELGAPLVGLSIPDADLAIDAFAFVRLLRRSGYAGHVTCGGALATLVRTDILARQPGIDSVVRHDGELPLVELAARVAAGSPWADVPGLTTRNGDGPPAPVADPTPLRLRPLRPRRLPRILGVPTARLLASRGCPGRCPYCGPAALQRQALEEGRRAGLDRETLDACGVGRTRRRTPADVADEAAELFHDRGVRFFHLMDDNLLSGGAEGAAAWLRSLIAELSRRKVGRTAWSLQMEPASVSDDCADALAELGAIRVLLGVEALTADGLRTLGRHGEPAASRAALERLRSRGMVTLFNSLLVHPGATPAAIAAELDALAELHGVHFDALSLAVYPGTEAWQRLCASGEASGGTLGWRFEPRNPVVARFRSALVRLRLQGAGRYGANVFAHDVAVNLALARRLGLPAWAPERQARLDSVIEELNRCRVAAWRGALELAATGLPREDRTLAVAHLVSELQRELARAWTVVDDVQSQLERAARLPHRSSNLLVRSALAAGFTLLLAPLGGCYSSSGAADAREDVPVDAGDDTFCVWGAECPSGICLDGRCLPVDGGVDARDDATRPDDADATIDEADDAGCTSERTWAERQRALATAAVAGCDPCFEEIASYGIALDEAGRIVDVVRQDGGAVPELVRTCYLEALAGETFPCLAGDEVWQECVICLF